MTTSDARAGRVFGHVPWVWQTFPRLTAVAVTVELVRPAEQRSDAVADWVADHVRHAATGPGRPAESTLASIAAWRAAFSQLGLRPTQYRCAAESLLRRIRLHGDLPRVLPLIDVCNAVSARFAIPVAALDLDGVAGSLRVRPATGDEVYAAFDGTVEHPEPSEVVYADDAGHAHSRRWCWRQSARSAVRPGTTRALIVAEALHEGGDADLDALVAVLTDGVGLLGRADDAARLRATAPDAPLSGAGRVEAARP